jgi:hypothetical protein
MALGNTAESQPRHNNCIQKRDSTIGRRPDGVFFIFQVGDDKLLGSQWRRITADVKLLSVTNFLPQMNTCFFHDLPFLP